MSLFLSPDALLGTVRAALNEDVGIGDLTTRAVISATRSASATLVAREACMLAGNPVAIAAFRVLDPQVKVLDAVADGTAVSSGDVVLRVAATAQAILTAERVALNFVQRLSGVATLTRKFVNAAGPRVKILHTRKTTPGLRELERYAVAVGGGTAHRAGLFDEVLLKENHFALSGKTYAETIAEARKSVPAGTVVGAEAVNRMDACAALEAGADYVLLDNFSPIELAEEVKFLRGVMTEIGRQVELEASGGIRLDNVALYAESGVDRISCGALTHSACSIDFALDVVEFA